jgi:DNA-directed RNA polymerase subunit beta'
MAMSDFPPRRRSAKASASERVTAVLARAAALDGEAADRWATALWWPVAYAVDPQLAIDEVGVPGQHWALAGEASLWLAPPGELHRGAAARPRRVSGGTLRISPLHPMAMLSASPERLWLGRWQPWLADRWVGVRDATSGRVARLPTAGARLGLYWLTGLEREAAIDSATVAAPPGAARLRRVSGLDEAQLAPHGGLIGLRTVLECRGRRTTLGRLLAMDAAAPLSPLADRLLDRPTLVALLGACDATLGAGPAVAMLARLEALGEAHRHRAGALSALGLALTSEARQSVLAEVRQTQQLLLIEFDEGLIADGERYHKLVNAGSQARDLLEGEVRGWLEREPSLLAELVGAGVLRVDQVTTLIACYGLMVKPGGDLHETAVLASVAHGLTPIEVWMRAVPARGFAWQARERELCVAHLWQRLVEAVGAPQIVIEDCGVERGRAVKVPPFGDGGLLGRVLASAALAEPERSRVVVAAGVALDDAAIDQLRQAQIARVSVRSVITCAARGGLCARCYGADPATGRLIAIGTAVGGRAARAIAEHAAALRCAESGHLC